MRRHGKLRFILVVFAHAAVFYYTQLLVVATFVFFYLASWTWRRRGAIGCFGRLPLTNHQYNCRLPAPAIGQMGVRIHSFIHVDVPGLQQLLYHT
jgi:hypothetical protein